MYYVVYGEKEVVEGPLPEHRAIALCEDLEFLFEDKHYHIVAEHDLASHHLAANPKFHIHEDMPVM